MKRDKAAKVSISPKKKTDAHTHTHIQSISEPKQIEPKSIGIEKDTTGGNIEFISA